MHLDLHAHFQALAQTHPSTVGAIVTKTDPTDNRDFTQQEVYGAIVALLAKANLASENEFEIAISVQGSTESGRTIRLSVVDSFLGPLEI